MPFVHQPLATGNKLRVLTVATKFSRDVPLRGVHNSYRVSIFTRN
jgi:hypothetical protein